MYPDENTGKSLEDYKATEGQFHRELMNVCRKYINDLSIVSILGILDIVKQESFELERATREAMTLEKSD